MSEFDPLTEARRLVRVHFGENINDDELEKTVAVILELTRKFNEQLLGQVFPTVNCT